MDISTDHQSKAEQQYSDKFITILFFSICLLYWGLTCGMWDLWGSDEGRYVRVAQEWLASNRNWFYLTNMGEAYDQKPPLPFWMFAAGVKLFGEFSLSWATRFPAVIAGAITVTLVWLAGLKLFNRRVGIAAAIITATSPLFMTHVPGARLDILYASWTMLAMYAWLTRTPHQNLSFLRSVVFWGAIAGAFFTKGPLVFIIVLCFVGAEAYSNRSWKFLKESRGIIGIPILIALIAGWLVIQGMNAGDEFVTNQVTEQTYERFLSGDHQEPFYYYFPRVFLGHLIPWSILIIPSGIMFWKNRKKLTSTELSLLGWVVIPFIFLCISSAKRNTYLLPLVPGAALLLAIGFDRLYLESNRQFPKLNKALLGILSLISAILLISGFMSFAYWPEEWNQKFALTPMLGVIALALSISLISVTVWFFKSRKNITAWQTFGVTAILMMTYGLIEFTIVNPAINAHKSTRQFSVEMTKILNDQTLGVIGSASNPKYHVYSSYPTVKIDSRSDIINPDLPDYVMIRHDDYEKALELIEQTDYEVYLDTVTDDDRIVLLNKSVDGDS